MPLEIRSVQKLRVYVHLVLEDGDRAEAMGAEDAGGGVLFSSSCRPVFLVFFAGTSPLALPTGFVSFFFSLWIFVEKSGGEVKGTFARSSVCTYT